MWARTSINRAVCGCCWSFRDDFTTDKCWVTDGNNTMVYCAAGDKLTWADLITCGRDNITKDLQDADALGACVNASDTAWLFRQKVNWSTYSPTCGQLKLFHSGLTDIVSLALVTGGCGDRLATAHDYRGNCSTERFRTTSSDCATVITVEQTNCWNFAGATDYYVEQTRDSATLMTAEMFSNVCFTTSVSAPGQTTILCTTQALRFLVFGNRGDSQGSAGTVTVCVNDVEFNDGTVCPP